MWKLIAQISMLNPAQLLMNCLLSAGYPISPGIPMAMHCYGLMLSACLFANMSSGGVDMLHVLYCLDVYCDCNLCREPALYFVVPK